MKKTLIIGASQNPERYAFKAFKNLKDKEHVVELLGLKKGNLDGAEFKTEWEDLDLNDLDTITLYISPKNQSDYIEKIVALKPNRVIFNPGTENERFYTELEKNDIFYEEACTLVLLNIGLY